MYPVSNALPRQATGPSPSVFTAYNELFVVSTENLFLVSIREKANARPCGHGWRGTRAVESGSGAKAVSAG